MSCVKLTIFGQQSKTINICFVLLNIDVYLMEFYTFDPMLNHATFHPALVVRPVQCAV